MSLGRHRRARGRCRCAGAGRRRIRAGSGAWSGEADQSELRRRGPAPARSGQPVIVSALADDRADRMRGLSEAYGSWKMICMSRRRPPRGRWHLRSRRAPNQILAGGARSGARAAAQRLLPQPDSPTSPASRRRRGRSDAVDRVHAWSTTVAATRRPDRGSAFEPDLESSAPSRSRMQHRHAGRGCSEPTSARPAARRTQPRSTGSARAKRQPSAGSIRRGRCRDRLQAHLVRAAVVDARDRADQALGGMRGGRTARRPAPPPPPCPAYITTTRARSRRPRPSRG